MDTAILKQDHSCYIAERFKAPGYFSNKTKKLSMTAFCILHAKSYPYKMNSGGEIEPKEEIRAKGIRKHVVDKQKTLEVSYI